MFKRFSILGLFLALLLVGTSLAETVIWDGSGDTTWTEPDTTSWSGGQYDSGDIGAFLGPGAGTVTVQNAGISPGGMDLRTNTYTIVGGPISHSGTIFVRQTQIINNNLTGAGRIESFNSTHLYGTNTYLGNTDADSGSITFHGTNAISPNTKFHLGDGARFGATIRLLIDDAGTVNLGNELSMTGNPAYEYGTSIVTVHVDNDGGATTGSTIALGKADFTSTAGNKNSARLIRSTGANEYGVQFGDCDLNTFFAGTMDGKGTGPQGFYSDTAPITITGTIKQVNGNSGNTNANYFFLGGVGVTTTNYVTGSIKDPDDYPANTNAQPLGLNFGAPASEYVPQCDAVWVLQGVNEFTGPTLLRYGLLIIDGGPRSECLSDVADLTIKSPGMLQLNEAVKEAVGGLVLATTSQPIGKYGSSLSAADNQNDTYFSGPGILYVGIPIPASGTVLILK